MRVKTKYKKFAAGGAVPVDDAAETPLGLQAQINALEKSIRDDQEAAAAWQETAELRKANAEVAFRQKIAAEMEAAKQTPQAPVDPTESTIANSGLPPLAQDWLRANPEYLRDGRKNQRLQDLHHELVAEGFEGYSPDYFGEIDRRLAGSSGDEDYVEGSNGALRVTEEPAVKTALRMARALAADEADDDYARPVRRPVWSAPPSREVPSSATGRVIPREVTLTAREKEAAAISGISEDEYAKQKLRLLQRKAEGDYGGSP